MGAEPFAGRRRSRLHADLDIELQMRFRPQRIHELGPVFAEPARQQPMHGSPISTAIRQVSAVAALRGLPGNDDAARRWHRPDHPARAMQDTSYLNNNNLLLRTQTTTIQP